MRHYRSSEKPLQQVASNLRQGNLRKQHNRLRRPYLFEGMPDNIIGIDLKTGLPVYFADNRLEQDLSNQARCLKAQYPSPVWEILPAEPESP